MGTGGAGPVGGGLATLVLGLLAVPFVVELVPFMLVTISSSLTSATPFVFGRLRMQGIQEVKSSMFQIVVLKQQDTARINLLITGR